jgi:hypothetical protein
MSRHFVAWHEAERKIRDLKERQMSALNNLMDQGCKLLLRRGRMRPALVTIVCMSMADRVMVERCDNGKRRWVDVHYLSINVEPKRAD